MKPRHGNAACDKAVRSCVARDDAALPAGILTVDGSSAVLVLDIGRKKRC
jgi:hypothetical protein